MKFGARSIDEAEGAVMAHTLRVGAAVVKKGTVLSADHIRNLRYSGQKTAMVAVLEDEDVAEDVAASVVARDLSGSGNEPTTAFTGRCNLVSKVHGVLSLDVASIRNSNRIDESLTIATLPNYAVVQPGQTIATVKVIPFAVDRNTLQKAGETLQANPSVNVEPFQVKNVGLVLTRMPGGRESLLDKTSRTLATRLESMGNAIYAERRCDHEEIVVSESITELKETGCDLIIVAGATATVDRSDTVPAGIVRAGGTIEHFGMPVDPGNLLLLGRLEGLYVIGMPGCARSLKLNGFDWVLQRVVAGIPISDDDFAEMAIGGLLEEMPNRPLPRERAVTPDTGSMTMQKTSKNIAVVILAAGQSSRMGAVNKLLAKTQGKTMIRHAVDAAMGSSASSIVVVTGYEAYLIEENLKGLPIRFIQNESFEQGISTSLKCGISALSKDVDGAVICLADMPNVEASHIDQLIGTFDPNLERSICVSAHKGRRGNPVLWSRIYFDEMMKLTGDEGARKMLRRQECDVYEVEMASDAILRDVDTPVMLVEQRGMIGGRTRLSG